MNIWKSMSVSLFKMISFVISSTSSSSLESWRLFTIRFDLFEVKSAILYCCIYFSFLSSKLTVYGWKCPNPSTSFTCLWSRSAWMYPHLGNTVFKCTTLTPITWSTWCTRNLFRNIQILQSFRFPKPYITEMFKKNKFIFKTLSILIKKKKFLY